MTRTPTRCTASTARPTYEYVAFLRAISDFSGDGKQQRVWDYINSLPLSTAQKDQLHYAAGYKESSLAKTPWH